MSSSRRSGRNALAIVAFFGAAITYACSDASSPSRIDLDSLTPDRALRSRGQGLVAAYGFDESSGSSVADASGNKNGGLLGAGVTRTPSGRFGAGISFTNGMVTIPNSSSLTLASAMTLEAWVKPSSVAAEWRDVIMKGNDNYYLMATSTAQSLAAGGGTFGGETATTKAFSGSPLSVNSWAHLAVTYDGVSIRLYVNGTQVSRVGRSGAIMTTNDPLQIGGDPFYGQYFQGTIDEVRIYNRALSAMEVRTDMNTPVGGDVPTPGPDTESPTVAITSPTTAATYATNANTLTLSGTASDNVGVAAVTWSNSRGGSGTATGASSWSASAIPLQSGDNIISITARDAAGNATIAKLTVTYNAPSGSKPGLVAAYGFSEGSGTTIADASGNSNNGSLGTGVMRTASGRFGSALLFQGNAMVTIPSSASLILASGMTLEAWVNPTSVTSAWRDVIIKGKDNYYLMATSSNNALVAGGGTFAADVGTTKTYSGSPLPTNAWTHIAVTYDGAAIRVYMNGAQVSTIARTGAISNSTQPLQIGGDPFFGQFFQGTIDEVRVYNRALSAAEVQTDMNTAVSGGQTSPPGPTPDTEAPKVAVTSPTTASRYNTNTSPVSLNGTATDNVGVTQVTWTNSRGGSGTATGTSNWSASGIALQSGDNILTLTARDAANNTATATLTVTYTVVASPTPKSLSIQTQPSSSISSGAVFTQQPVIQLRDASNTAVAQAGVVVTAAIASGGGTLGGTSTVTTNANGVAAFSNLSITGTAGSRTLSFSASGLTGVTSSAIAVSTPPPSGNAPPSSPPPSGEPVYTPGVSTLIYRDNMDAYSDVVAMGAVSSSTTPRITPHPSPITNSQPVKSGSQLVTGRGGTGKALRLAYAGANQEEQQFITLNMPRTPDLTTHYLQYWGRVSPSAASSVIPVKWFELWHNSGRDRIQFNTHDPLPCTGTYRTYWQVYDQSRETTCQGNQPIGPYFATVADGQWHRFTYSYRPNSAAGARDGFARMWVDGVKIIDVSAATIGVTPPGGTKPWCLADDVDALAVNDGIHELWWGSTQTLPSSAWTYDIDDLIWWR